MSDAPEKQPLTLEEQLDVRNFIEESMQDKGWTSLGTGYGFGVADVMLTKVKNGKEVHLTFDVYNDHVEINIDVHEEEIEE